MEIILTHEQADFDAAASVLAAWLLDPARIPVLPKRRNRNLAVFMDEYKNKFPFESLNSLPKAPITRIYLTDTQMLVQHNRLNGVSDIVIWDHHPHRHLFPDRDENIYESTGACTTFLVEKLSACPDVHPGRLFSTLMLMGIYEDTGFLSYGSTTARDIRAAAWLVENGGDLDMVRRYIQRPLTDHQQQACDLLLRNCSSYEISGKKFIIASADVREISDEYASVAHHLRDMLSPDGLLLLLGTRSGIRLIGRATTDDIDFSRLMKHFHGGGHSRAASALVPIDDPETPDMPVILEELKKETVGILPDYITPQKQNLWQKMELRLTADQMALIRKTAEMAERLNMPVYIVGGVVRDLLLDRPLMDFDIVAEGEAPRLGRELAAAYGGSLTVHAAFLTAKWTLPDGKSLDLISARSESYPEPAALPQVVPGSISEDLHRRDFTLNTLAVRLDGENRGELLDCCGGLSDLRQQLIRTLHDRSFIDDPTRIFRAIRFEQRFDFMLEPDTLRQMREQLAGVERLTGQRIWHELRLYCKEPSPEKLFARISQLGIASQIHGGMVWQPMFGSEIVRFRTGVPALYWKGVSDADLEKADAEGPLWIWLSSLPGKVIAETGSRLLLENKTLRCIRSLSMLREYLPRCTSEKASEISFVLDSVPGEALYCYSRFCSAENELGLIESYMTRWRHMTPALKGNDLLRMGFPSGPKMAEILRQLRAKRIDGEIRTREEEIMWLRNPDQKDL